LEFRAEGGEILNRPGRREGGIERARAERMLEDDGDEWVGLEANERISNFRVYCIATRA
jgi:hypothetical protein